MRLTILSVLLACVIGHWFVAGAVALIEGNKARQLAYLEAMK